MSEFDFNYNESNNKKKNKKDKAINFFSNNGSIVIVGGSLILFGLIGGYLMGYGSAEDDYEKTKGKECAAIVIQNGEVKVYDLGTQEVKKKMDKNYEKYYFEENKTAVYIIYGDEAYNRAQLITYNIELDKNNYLINDGLFSDEYYYEYKKLDENGVKTSSISRKAE